MERRSPRTGVTQTEAAVSPADQARLLIVSPRYFACRVIFTHLLQLVAR
jgi:hypothetical protein